jgi:hypothetical protein
LIDKFLACFDNLILKSTLESGRSIVALYYDGEIKRGFDAAVNYGCRYPHIIDPFDNWLLHEDAR